MHEELERQIARNETTFREVNEAIQSGHWPGEGERKVAFRCECGALGCTTLVEMTAGEYERIRGHPRRFLLAAHHEMPLAETVVETHRDYIVVEKRGEAGRIAEANDPRG